MEAVYATGKGEGKKWVTIASVKWFNAPAQNQLIQVQLLAPQLLAVWLWAM